MAKGKGKSKAKKTAREREAAVEKIMAKVNETCEHAMDDMIVQPADLEEIEMMLYEAMR